MKIQKKIVRGGGGVGSGWGVRVDVNEELKFLWGGRFRGGGGSGWGSGWM